MPRVSALSSLPAQEAAQAAGFLVGGEPLSIELADTLVTAGDPPADLISDQQACRRFWDLQASRLPDGWAAPSLSATRHLRDAIRALLESARLGQPLDESAVAVVNRAIAKAPIAASAKVAGRKLLRTDRWSAKAATDLPLAAAARSAVDILTDPGQLHRLRRCANPNCSMLFVHGDTRRQWCTPNICGNRARVARHYRRRRSAAADRC